MDAFQGGRSEALICFRENDEYVVRAYGANMQPVVLRGDKAIERLHQASRDKVRAFSVPGKAELFHVSREGDQVVLQIGKRLPIKLDSQTWDKWLVEPDAAPPHPFADLMDDLANQGAELVVMRDALQAVPRRLAKKKSSGSDGQMVAMGSTLRAHLERLKLTPEELDGRIDKLKKSVETVDDANREIVQKAVAELEWYKSLTPENRTVLIKEIEASPLKSQIDQAVARTNDDAVSLAGKLKSQLQRIRVSYDDPSSAVPARISKEAMVKSKLDVGLAVPPAEAGVDDKGTLRRIVDAFEDSGIPLVKTPADLERVGNVIIVTAHNDQALFDYVQSLGEHQIGGQSALDGKFLMLTTCFEEGNPNMVSELLRRYNCAGVHVQAERVHKDAVQYTLMELGARLSKLEAGAPSQRLRDLYDDTLEELINSPDPQLKFLKGEFEKLQRARVQWCLHRRTEPRQVAGVLLG